MPHPGKPSYEELAAQNAELTARVSELAWIFHRGSGLLSSVTVPAF
jgi:hypothetical protein